MKVLVTGPHGYLGSAFIELLKQKNISFIEYDRKQPTLSLDFDTVVHFAGLTPHSQRENVPTQADFFEANVEGTKQLLSTIEKNKQLKRFVHIGTSAEYGFSRHVLRESTKERPETPYGRSKLAQSELIRSFSKERGIKTFNLRIFNLLGVPRQYPVAQGTLKRQFIAENMLTQFSRNVRTISISNRLDARDYISLPDALEAIYAALISKKGLRYELVNICSGKGTKLGEMVETFARELNRTYSLRETSDNSTSSIGTAIKAKKLLGWAPRLSFQESVRKVIATRKRVLVIGAGVAGEMVAKELERNEHSDIILVGFVDDDPEKSGTAIRGVKVIGSIQDIPRIVAAGSVDQILVSTPSVGGLVPRLTELLPPGFPMKILPSISSVILGHVDLSYVRNIDPTDLIGRPLEKTGQQRIASKAKGKSFLVTGGAGSIGSEIVRQLSSVGAKKVVVYDSWEEGVFNLMEEMHSLSVPGGTQVIAKIGNVRDRERLDEILREHPVDVILHAAAYKHVPLMEENEGEARKTNIGGTKQVIEAAIKAGVTDFVLISTDKAVRPSSVMGKTKREAELLMKTYAKKNPKVHFCAVRFGNVLNSSGSMLPKFLRQIRSRTALTITHKDMTRYFMSIPEAVSLVLTAWIVSKNGQILLLDMGKPAKILDFAISLIKLHGLVPYQDIPIVEIGMRPGEKIHEELAYDSGKLKRASAPRIFIAEELD